jgi:hypothetical protein
MRRLLLVRVGLLLFLAVVVGIMTALNYLKTLLNLPEGLASRDKAADTFKHLPRSNPRADAPEEWRGGDVGQRPTGEKACY